MRLMGLGRAALAVIAVIVLAANMSAAAHAGTGYWRYAGFATRPPQSQLDAVKAGPGRVFEQRVGGAFQPAKSGAGTIDLFFRADDADRRLYLTTLTFSFTTGVDMRALTAGQELHFKGVLTMGGNGLSKAIPASGSGKIAADNGDYFVTIVGAIDQTVGGAGVFKVPSGTPGSSLVIYAAAYEASLGGLSGTLELHYQWEEGPPPLSANQATQDTFDALGSRMDVSELDGLWTGVWTRRPGTNIFDAAWHSANYPEVRDVIRIESITGNKVVLTRDGNGGRYYGVLSSDGRSITGTASWYSSGMTWSARISR